MPLLEAAGFVTGAGEATASEVTTRHHKMMLNIFFNIESAFRKLIPFCC